MKKANQKGIQQEVEIIPIQDINEAFDKMMDKEVRYPYVVDMQSLKMKTLESHKTLRH